ncbi:MAG: MFS transporter [Spirochaetales bacterium]|nr:MFS transporter [Spirochaetales bacterium]
MTKTERSWILYDVANSAYTLTIESTIFPIFYKTYIAAGLPSYESTAHIGYANSINTLVILFLAPILGTLADYKGKKKKIFSMLLFVGILLTLCFVLISQGQYYFAIILYIVATTGYAGANVFYDSMLVDVTSEDRMDWVSSSGFAWGYIGSCIPFIICIVLISGYKTFGFSSSVIPVRIAFIMTALWWGFMSIPILKDVHQKYFIEASKTPIRDSFKRILETFKQIKQYKGILIFLCAYFLYIDGVYTIIKMATSFGTDAGIGSTMLLVVLLVTQIIAFPFALLYGKLAKHISAKKMLFVGIFIYFIITILAFFLPTLPTQGMKVTMFWILAMLVATSQGGMQALSRSIFAKMIPKNKSAEFFGFYNIFGKFSTLFGPFIMGAISAMTKESRFGLLSIILLFIGGGIALMFVKPEAHSTS